jgi:hypothetical protein
MTGAIDQIAAATGEHREDVKRVVCEYFMRRWKIPDAEMVRKLRESERHGGFGAVALPRLCRRCGAPTPRCTGGGKQSTFEKFCTHECRRLYKEENPQQ